ncbi:CubicO group peptidase, beta-lactamase class C family [Sinosporangium album]|uniref:CubicO group peptidase, beta-lactamase class C family n=1 Tax=Sinosporangium album TaxID=504805 RepID=A0A1G8GAJ9_9ACTN|nr:serine hydrolase domain-containing protein [Sinosporangium album]SDH91310.1 CubicO group peptidase, beta-lactamase class C family [Sinosporangium album]
MKLAFLTLAASVGLATTLTTASPTPAVPTSPPSAADFDAYLKTAIESTGLPGLSVVVTRGDTVVHAAGYGRDSLGAAITERTPMRVASLTKSFTAAAVMTLVEDGKIALDEPVASQLPGFRMADPRAGRITVRHLLNQTSGLSDTTVDIGAAHATASLADYVATLKAGTLRAEPGTRYEYCNVNFDLAARLVEVAGGQSFGDYMRQHVFGMLGMSGSAVGDPTVKPADGFVSLYGAWLPRPEIRGFLNLGGSGGVITTATDMGRWLMAQNGAGSTRLVTRESLRTMHAPSAVHDYAMGWSEETLHGTPLLVHSGNLFTYSAVQAIAPGTGYGFAVMTNGTALQDDTYTVLGGLVALSQGVTPEKPGGGRQQIELTLGLITAVSAGLGILGVARSRRWAATYGTRRAWRIAVRLSPALAPLPVLAAYPDLISFLMNGRTVTWEQLTYYPALTITLGVMAAAGAATAASRLFRLRSVRSNR